MNAILSRIVRKIQNLHRLRLGSASFLKKAKGVIHIGANIGQERDDYQYFNLPVVWVEPNPKLFPILVNNLAPHPRQRGLCYLISDRDEDAVDFHISNNDGLSSSLLALKDHQILWPDVKFTETLRLQTYTLPTMLRKEGINPSDYNILVLDTQGSELSILQGTKNIIQNFRFIQIESYDFELYEGCATLDTLCAYMTENGFQIFSKTAFAHKVDVGTCYNIVFTKVDQTTKA